MKSCIRQVFDFIRLSRDKEALLKLVESDDSYHHMDEDAFEVITTYTNSKELREQMEKMQQENREKGEKKDMCKAIKDLMEDSRAEGRAEGRNESIREMTKKLLKEGVSMEIIAKATGLMKEEVREIEMNMLVSQ